MYCTDEIQYQQYLYGSMESSIAIMSFQYINIREITFRIL